MISRVIYAQALEILKDSKIRDPAVSGIVDHDDLADAGPDGLAAGGRFGNDVFSAVPGQITVIRFPAVHQGITRPGTGIPVADFDIVPDLIGPAVRHIVGAERQIAPDRSPGRCRRRRSVRFGFVPEIAGDDIGVSGREDFRRGDIRGDREAVRESAEDTPRFPVLREAGVMVREEAAENGCLPFLHSQVFAVRGVAACGGRGGEIRLHGKSRCFPDLEGKAGRGEGVVPARGGKNGRFEVAAGDGESACDAGAPRRGAVPEIGEASFPRHGCGGINDESLEDGRHTAVRKGKIFADIPFLFKDAVFELVSHEKNLSR